MIFNKQMLEFPITVYEDLGLDNNVLTRKRARIFYKYGNRNGTYITDEFAQKLVNSLPYTPVKGIYSVGEGDYTDHGAARDMGRIYGIVPEDPNVAWETFQDEDGVLREYCCADVLLFTALYQEAEDIVGKAQSMELYEKTLQGNWQFIQGQRYFVFTDGCFLGLQVLGDEVEPCFEGAAFYELSLKLSDIIKKIEQFNLSLNSNQVGGTKMPNINFKLSDNQKYSAIWALLNPNFNEESEWAVDYSICDVYDSYAIVRNHAAGTYERAYYTKDDSTDSLKIDKVETCYIVDVNESEKNALDTLQKLNNGTYEKIDDNYNQLAQQVENLNNEKENYELKISELESNISTLETEKSEISSQFENANTLLNETKNSLETIQSAYSVLEAERDSLVSYKEGIEKAEKEAIISSYSEVLSEETLAEYTSKISEYTATELDKELAYELKTSNPSMFTKKQTPQSGYVPKDEPTGGIEEILARYNK